MSLGVIVVFFRPVVFGFLFLFSCLFVYVWYVYMCGYMWAVAHTCVCLSVWRPMCHLQLLSTLMQDPSVENRAQYLALWPSSLRDKHCIHWSSSVFPSPSGSVFSSASPQLGLIGMCHHIQLAVICSVKDIWGKKKLNGLTTTCHSFKAFSFRI